MDDELETARQKMLENYPLTESKYFDAWALDTADIFFYQVIDLLLLALWLEWIEDTKKSSAEDRDKIKQLYMQATKDYLCKCDRMFCI